MERENVIQICQRAVAKYGKEAQVFMAMEEMAELGNALMKEKRGRVTKEDIITEIADVIIMMFQMAIIYGSGEVYDEIERKAMRLQDRLDK